jgi:hypothetical protein
MPTPRQLSQAAGRRPPTSSWRGDLQIQSSFSSAD